MNDTCKLLEEVDSGCKMAINSMNRITSYKMDEKLAHLIDNYKYKHMELEKQAAESEASSANGENTELEAESSTEDESSQFIVQVGEAPSSISERLEEGGWITNAEEFTVFLVNNGYDTVIVAAEYQIPFDADMEAIAKIITKNKRIRSRPTQPEIPTMPETSPVTQ